MIEIADRQYGVVSLAQLVALGASARTVRGWVASGRLQRIHREVFVVGHRSLRREGHWMAAVLACGPGAVLSHRSAAAHWDLRSSAATRLDVTAPLRAGRARVGIRVHCGARLAADEVTAHLGIPCTTVARTLLDLAVVLDQRPLERACERAERLELFDLWALTGLLARHRGRRGSARLRMVLAEWDADLARTRSELEVVFLRQIIRTGIERPIVNGRIELPGMTPEVDFHWPDRRLVIETDGDAFHRTPRARSADAERDRALTDAGWRVHRFTYWDVVDKPDRTLTTVRILLSLPSPAPNGS